MEAIDRSRFYSGGFFLIRHGNPDWPNWNQLKTDLLPDDLLSLSNCITRRFAIHWAWIPGDKDAAIDFGVREAAWDEFVGWSSKSHNEDIDYPSMFYSADAARRTAKRFLTNLVTLHLIEVGLPQALEAVRWRNPEIPPDRLMGVEKRILERLPLSDTGMPLGFEVVSYGYNDFQDSWLCSCLEQEMHELFGIRPGPYGLIQTEAEARQVYAWIEEEDEMKGHRAEPEPYEYWLLIEHSLEITAE